MAMTSDLLFELGTEELPPAALLKLSESLGIEFTAGLNALSIGFSSFELFAAPRRLGLLIKDCELQQPDKTINRRGPAKQAAFDKDGNPSKAAQGFAASCGTSVDKLETTKTDKGEWLSFNLHEAGKKTIELLPEVASTALDKLPIPKRMRWGDSDAQFVRPVHWLVFMLGKDIVPCTILDAKSDRFSFGHRFHNPAAIEISSPAEYANILRDKGKVIANFATRREMISSQVKAAALSVNGQVQEDPDLLDEVTALVEWPVAVLGNFEEEFLEIPHEAVIMTMKKNQKYFPVHDSNGQLLNHFITIANIESSNPDVIRQGNERVIRPRLTDAKFFWDQDAKLSLQDRLDKLKSIVFQKELGSIYDKSSRVSALSAHIAGLLGSDSDLASRAGLLSRCDLVTESVFEFPELQGIVGRYQAKRDGETDELAQAMDEMYMPRFSGDQLPSTKTGIAVALADRFDSLTGIFGIGLKPSGTKDPFALRRATLGIIRILREHLLTLDVSALVDKSIALHGDQLTSTTTASDVLDYIDERRKGVFVDAGFSVNLVKAVAAVEPLDIPDFENRLVAVKFFSDQAEASTLAAANKRISNILRKTDDRLPDSVDPHLFESAEEATLYTAIQTKQQSVKDFIKNADYQSVLTDLTSLAAPVDSFFDNVMVMCDDNAVRLNRLALLHQLSSLFLQVADISVLQDS